MNTQPQRQSLIPLILSLMALSFSTTTSLAATNTCTTPGKGIENSDLRYTLTHSQVPGQLAISQHRLKVTDKHYQLESISEAKGLLALMFSGQLVQKSEGLIDNNDGLSSLYYAEKRGKKPLTETTTNPNTREITFKKNNTHAPWERKLQDRLSMIYQISAQLRCGPALKKGDTLTLRIMGTGRLSTEIFTVLDPQTELTLDLGKGKQNIPVIELESKPENPDDDTIRLAFAKTLNWVPVKIQLTDQDGQSVTQTLIGLQAPNP